MTCREFIEVIDELLEASLASESARECEDHLAKCPNCASYLRTYRATIDLMRSALAGRGDEPVPRELQAHLTNILREVRRDP